MIIITHPERRIYKYNGDTEKTINNILFHCDRLSCDRKDWNEDPFIWSKYPLYSFCHSNHVWAKDRLEQIQGIEYLLKPKEDELLLFASPIFSNRTKCHKQRSLGTSKNYSTFNGIMFDTVITPLCLIELPVNKKVKIKNDKGNEILVAKKPYLRTLESIKNRIETLLKELKKSANHDKKILDAIEYIRDNYEYISTWHFPIEEIDNNGHKKEDFSPNIHNRKIYLAIGDPRSSYLATSENKLERDNDDKYELSRKICCHSAKRFGSPMKEQFLIENKLFSRKKWDKYFNDKDNKFISFEDLFDGYNIDTFKRIRKKLKLQNNII